MKTDNNQHEILAEIHQCIPVLEKIANNSELMAHLPESKRIALITAAGKISRPDKTEIKKRNKDKREQKRKAIIKKERRIRAATGIRKARKTEIFTAPQQITFNSSQSCTTDNTSYLETPRNCYVCKAEFTQLHHFYDTMCPKCAQFNYEKRFQTASLKDQVVLITGSRLKIGYQAT